VKLLMVDRDKIRVEGYRVRFKSGGAEIDDLADSIRTHGLLCPIVVSRQDDSFLLVAGERRLAAMVLLGWEKIPAVIPESRGGGDILVKGLVENIARLNLSPLEKAMAMREIVKTYKYTQEQLAEQLGIDRTSVTHSLRMIDILHPQVLKYLHEGSLTFGHAKVLMKLEDRTKQLEIARRVVLEGLTITQTALLVDQARPPHELTPEEKELNQIERDIKQAVGEKWWQGISIRQGEKKEKLMVDFTDRKNLRELLLKILQAL